MAKVSRLPPSIEYSTSGTRVRPRFVVMLMTLRQRVAAAYDTVRLTQDLDALDAAG